jgi:MFS family permease
LKHAELNAPELNHPDGTLVLPAAEQRKIVSGLQVAIFVAAIDSTLVSVALLSIARDLGGASLIAWVIAGYTVAATVATPVYGSLSDQYGRQRMMTIAIVIYIVACLGCVFAQTMSQLLLLRVMQGLGGGGLVVLAQSTIGDVVPPTERGRFQAWLSGTYALAALTGPIASGYLTTWFSWRSVFIVTLPLALIALLLTRRIMGRLSRPRRVVPPDYPSVLILAVGLTSLLIALTRIGQGASLADPIGAALVVSGAGFLFLFWHRQYQVTGPIMAPDLLNNRRVLWGCAASALVFFALVGGAVMLPLALQTIAGDTPDQVALKMLVHALAVPCGAFFSGRMMPKTMRFRRNMIIGALLGAGSAAALAVLQFSSPIPVGMAMFGLGLGVGISLPPGIIAVQVAVASNRIGAVTAFMGLARSLGSAIGLAMLTSILFSAIGASGGGSAAMLVNKVGPTDPALLYGFSMVFACMAGALALSAAAAMNLPAGAATSKLPD